MMATSAPVWKSLRVCLADPLALSHPQANLSQSQGCRGEVSEETQHLIGDGLTDWMTEEVDFSSYLPHPPSPPSSTNASLPPSPLHNDIQVPSDLEVMTSLLQEELAQLEDYFLSEPLPEKGPRLGKCDKGPVPAGPQAFSQLPYASYPTSNQPETSPLLVTLATGELDLLSICGGPLGRSKIPRHAPYSCSRPTGSGRKRVDGLRFSDGYDTSLLSSKGSNSGSSALTLTGSYSCADDEQLLGKSYCLGSAVEVRRCQVLPKEEKNCCFSQDILGTAKIVSGGFGFGGPIEVPHKKEDLLMYSMREVSGGTGSSEVLNTIKTSVEVTKATVSWKSEGSECYLPTTQSEAYHSFLGNINEQVKAESLQMGQHDLHCGFLEEQSSECFLMSRESVNLESSGHRQACRLKEDHCPVKYEVDIIPVEGGERKQKKRDQNKTAAHRYRQRKRAELDSLEEQLHCLEGRNRELRDKAESVEREIQYVKDLLIEVYKARSQRLKQDTTA
ncbi:uncharacterized protein atf5a [Periophthalmus magnuspinnatus]|uniref:BZIP domain-containing protein n=1 Tax=Periophthalmus magnuspinnatus TaxID=409849 RepID=A0A3B3ZH32_9GOBI|nr:uncharacterized protein atf5a [Periophthalmus magnuspinnatus]